MKNRLFFLVALLVIVVYPFLTKSNYLLHLGIMTGIWIILSTSLNLVLGYTGQTPLGHTAFFGIGAFTAGIISVRYNAPLYVTLPMGVIGSALASYFLGRVTLQLRGAYFVLSSLAFAEVLKLVAINWESLTGGPSGLTGIAPINIPSLDNLLRPMQTSYFLIWALVGLVLLIVYRLINSSIGRSLIAISENEKLAGSIGIHVYRFTLGALLLSAGIAGLGGAYYAHYISFISPDLFYLTYTVTMLVMVISGGRRTFVGPIVGAVVFTILPELLRSAESYRMAIYGIIIILTITYFPEGFFPFLRTKLKSVARSQ
ncbi:MAG: hypothetical protein APF81_16565 [Desulfosporosinus sp. BRH_c37]|nr:MAG: hypothetical protein APF81_16565 [Desulfosporosinus sp. BRH_c37]